MTYKLPALSFQQAVSTRDKIIEILSYSGPITAKKLHAVLKKKYMVSVTYQAVHKLLLQLSSEKIVVKSGREWTLNQQWIEERAQFFKKLQEQFKDKEQVLGKKIKAFFFDVNGVLTPEMTHVEFAKKSLHYEEIKKLIALQTLGKMPIKEAFTKISSLVRGITLYEVVEYSQNFELMPGITELINHLKKHHIKICLVTTGFRIAMDCFNLRLGNPFDQIICNEFIFADEKSKELSFEATRKIIQDKDIKTMKKTKIKTIRVIIDSPEKKTKLLEQFLTANHLDFSNACCVGESMGDADMIKIASEKGGLGIAFNPNLSLIEYAHYLKDNGHNIQIIESKDLRDIIELFS